jgi:hypothetical protein
VVAIPKIAQKMVDDASLPVYSARIMNPTPDSVTYSLVASLNVPKPFSVEIDPVTLDLFVPDKSPIVPYAKVTLGQQTLYGNSSITVNNQTAKISDYGEWVHFLTDAVLSETFTLAASGNSEAHLGALKVPFNLDKRIELKGKTSRFL